MQQERSSEDRPDEQTAVGLPRTGSPSDAGTQVGLPLAASPGQLCNVCRQPIDPGSLYCQACGAETSSVDQPAESNRQPAWFPVVMVGWLIVMIVALVLLYSFAIQVG